MLDFSRSKIVFVLAVVVGGILFALPNVVSRDRVPFPDFMKPISLGLDLRGGSYLLLEVGVDDVITERLSSLVETVRDELRTAGIRRYRDLGVRGDAVTVRLVNSEDLEAARTAVAKAGAGVTEITLEDLTFTLRFTAQELSEIRKKAVTQSIEIVRRRIDEFGTSEPTIQRQGDDRVIVELPGVDEPERVKNLLGKTAKLNFHLLDSRYPPGAPVEGNRAPPGSMIVPSLEEDEHGNPVTTYVVRKRIEVPGESLVDSQPTTSQNSGGPVVSFRFDGTGARRFGQVSSNNVGKHLAIVLDGKVISAPRINSPIIGGSGIIEGGFTFSSASDLALLLRSGALPAPLTILEERSVGPGLGADSILAGEFASGLGLSLVVFFMLAFYGLFGVFAVLALTSNIILLMAALSILGATLTLPGIAGIVLTVGMAVDANVLIFERMREERRNGRTLSAAMETGFGQAFKAIFDSNVTTLIAALLLFIYGSGPVRGFAVTLGVGILTSMFSAIMITRLLVVVWMRRRRPQELPIL